MRWLGAVGISVVTVCLTLGGSTAASGAGGDCGQPTSTGNLPTAGDALLVLKASVGQATVCDDSPCICDVDDNGSVIVSDALLILKKAVGHSVVLACSCPPPCDYVPFAATADEITEAFEQRLDSSGNFEVPPACDTSIPLCCPGGTPLSPCGPLHFDFVPKEGESGPTLTQLSEPDQFAFDIPVRVNTVSDLPVTVPLVGECGLRIDTTGGDSPRIHVQGTLEFSTDRISMSPLGGVTVNGLTSADLALTGSFSCTLANSALDFSLTTLRAMIEEQLASSGQLCRQCDTLELVPCGS